MSYDLSSNLLSVPSPITLNNTCRVGLRDIPLNLLAYILSYISDARTLAACCATSRLLHYMALPALYRNITLTSYDDTSSGYFVPDNGLRYASAFCMGLNALVTRKTTPLVRSLHLQGEWSCKEQGTGVKNVRLSDSLVLLNISVRAALDRCVNLQSFKWTLHTRMLSTVYSGLADLKHLRSLKIRFPSDQEFQSQAVIPALPQLRELGFTEYDPRCYPDDLSVVLLHATGLESLSIHFSSRMRDAGDSNPLLRLFHRNVAQNKKLSLKSIAVYNIFSNPNPEVYDVFLPDRLEEITVINSFGLASAKDKSQATHWIDQDWASRDGGKVDMTKMKMIRSDKVNHLTIQDLETMPNLERIYLVNPYPPKVRTRHGLHSPAPSRTSSSDAATPIGPPIEIKSIAPRFSQLPYEVLRDSLMNTIGRVHGAKLKHIILPARLPTNVYSLARLVASCPNLTQLAFAMEEVNPEALRHIGPSARLLRCCRILAPDAPGPEGKEQRKKWDEFIAREDHDYYFDLEFRGAYGNNPLDTKYLRYMGMGHKVWEVGTLYWTTTRIKDENGDEVEQRIYERSLKQITLEDVEHVELWMYDNLDPV